MDGEKWLFTERQKTLNPVRVPILTKAQKIIDKYKNHPRSIVTGTLFPNISNQKLNSYLKEIADLCGIDKNLTFHLARHTFATTVTLTNGVPIESVSKMLGHSDLRTTQIYAKVVERKISEDMSNLQKKLNEASKQITGKSIKKVNPFNCIFKTNRLSKKVATPSLTFFSLYKNAFSVLAT